MRSATLLHCSESLSMAIVKSQEYQRDKFRSNNHVKKSACLLHCFAMFVFVGLLVGC